MKSKTKNNENKLICESCKERGAEHVHHKDNNHKNNEPSNLQELCTLCHAKIHGVSPKQSELKRLVIFRDRAIIIRNALENQIRGFGRIEYEVPKEWVGEKKQWDSIIKGYEKEIKAMLKSGNYNVWDNFLSKIKGISFITAAKFISFIDIKNSPSVSALWRYCGLDASHIKRTNKISKEEAKKFGNPYLKKELLGILADSFIKQRTPIYREIYDNEKKRQIELHKAGMCERCNTYNLQNKPAHPHARARRKMVKIFVANFWEAYRKSEGLPVTEPYVFDKLNHKTKIEIAEVIRCQTV